MKQQVVLNGFLGDKYGADWEINCNSYAQIFQCIEANYPEFRDDVIDLANAGGGLDISVRGELIVPEDLDLPLAPEDTLYITPVPAGAKSGGAKLLAAAVIAVAFFYFGGPAALAGQGAFLGAGGSTATLVATMTATLAINLAITGIQQLLAPDPSVDDEEQDYLFKGPQQTVASGNPVPVLFGEMIIGGFMISSYVIGGESYTGSYGHIGYLPPGLTYGNYYNLTNSRTITDQLAVLNSTGVSEINSAIPDEPADITMANINRNVAIFGVFN